MSELIIPRHKTVKIYKNLRDTVTAIQTTNYTLTIMTSESFVIKTSSVFIFRLLLYAYTFIKNIVCFEALETISLYFNPLQLFFPWIIFALLKF